MLICGSASSPFLDIHNSHTNSHRTDGVWIWGRRENSCEIADGTFPVGEHRFQTHAHLIRSTLNEIHSTTLSRIVFCTVFLQSETELYTWIQALFYMVLLLGWLIGPSICLSFPTYLNSTCTWKSSKFGLDTVLGFTKKQKPGS